MKQNMTRLILLALVMASVVFGRFPAWAAAVHEAAAAGDLDKVRALIQADPGLLNLRERGTTPLHEAARNGRIEVVKFLVQRGADVNIRDMSGLTPLRLAMGYQRKEVVDWLRSQGGLESVPSVTTKSAPGPVPKPPALVPERPAVTPLPAAQPTKPTAPPEARPGTPTTPAMTNRPPATLQADAAMDPLLFPIHEAALVGDAEHIKRLVRTWPELMEAQDDRGLTPLHVAAGNGRQQVVEALLGRRANVHASTKFGWVPLHFAATNGDPATIKLLLAYGAQVQAKTRNDETPLHLACRSGHLAAAQLLLEAKAEVNPVEKTAGSTPLHLAAVAGSEPLVSLLLAKGANVNAADAYGDTPLSLALPLGREGVIRVLRQHGGREPAGRVFNAVEQSLVDSYRKMDEVLQRGGNAEKRKVAMGLLLTPAEARRLFPKNASEAANVAEEMQTQLKAELDKGLKGNLKEGEIWHIEPGPPTPYVQQCQSQGLIASDVPICTLLVKRQGQRASEAALYCLINGRWLPLPPLGRILPQP
jgi:ankyrin repeat protein